VKTVYNEIKIISQGRQLGELGKCFCVDCQQSLFKW